MENDKFNFVIVGQIENQNYFIKGNDLDVLLDKFAEDLSQSYVDVYNEELDDDNNAFVKHDLKYFGRWSDDCKGWFVYVLQKV